MTRFISAAYASTSYPTTTVVITKCNHLPLAIFAQRHLLITWVAQVIVSAFRRRAPPVNSSGFD